MHQQTLQVRRACVVCVCVRGGGGCMCLCLCVWCVCVWCLCCCADVAVRAALVMPYNCADVAVRAALVLPYTCADVAVRAALVILVIVLMWLCVLHLSCLIIVLHLVACTRHSNICEM